MKEFVIRYDAKPKSYFRQMTGIGPQFGAKLLETPRFPTVQTAQTVINRFPFAAACSANVIAVKGTGGWQAMDIRKCDMCPRTAIWKHPKGGFRCENCPRPNF